MNYITKKWANNSGNTQKHEATVGLNPASAICYTERKTVLLSDSFFHSNNLLWIFLLKNSVRHKIAKFIPSLNHKIAKCKVFLFRIRKQSVSLSQKTKQTLISGSDRTIFILTLCRNSRNMEIGSLILSFNTCDFSKIRLD